MSGFILETLSATGWKRSGDLYWRLIDAKAAAERNVNKRRYRACRVLPVSIAAEEVFSVEQRLEPSPEPAATK